MCFIILKFEKLSTLQFFKKVVLSLDKIWMDTCPETSQLFKTILLISLLLGKIKK